MRLTLTTFLSIDGVMQGPGGPEEDRGDGFDWGGWLVPYADADMGRIVGERFARADAFLLGRRTYQVMAAHWPRVTDPADPVASRLNALPKYVVSTTLRDPGWSGTTVLSGDVVAEAARLRERSGGELQIHGSGRLARSLMAANLIDEYQLWIYPVVVGAGRRLFPEAGPPLGLRLVESVRTGTGVLATRYRPTGPPAFGALGLDAEQG